MRRDDIPTALIVERLTDAIERLCGEFWPAGRVVGNLFYGAADGDRLGSFQVRLRPTGKHEAGSWNRYSQNIGGGVLNLIAYGLSGETRHTSQARYADEIRWAKRWLGIDRPETPAERALRAANDQRKREAEARRAEAEAARKAEHVRDIWAGAVPLSLDPPDVAARYLIEAHRLPIGDIERPDRLLRCHPGLWHWTARRQWPALISPVYLLGRDAAGAVGARLGGVQAEFIDLANTAGKGKARVGAGHVAKLTRGAIKGGIVPLARGPSGLSVGEALAAGVREDVILCEGVRTGLAIAIANLPARVWAALSVANIGEAPVWLDCVARVFVAIENDQHRTALATRDQSIALLRAQHKEVRPMRPWTGSDFADLY